MTCTGRAAAALAACLWLLAIAPAAALAPMDLHSLPWRLGNTAGGRNVSLEVQLPTTVAEALQAAGVLGDPMYRWLNARVPVQMPQGCRVALLGP